MDRLKNKTALITGGTSGIGLETAHHFLREGARVAVTGVSPSSIEAARESLGKDAIIIPSDSGDLSAQHEMVDAVREAFGKLDILFVNAGIIDMRPLEQWSEAGFDRSFDINFKGPFFLIQALLPIFANPASIVLNASINAHIGMPNSSVYSATKAALLSLVKTFSGELIGRGIRLNAISPGPVASGAHEKIGMTKADIDSLITQIPAGRRGKSSEIAQAVVFLASDESAFTVGSELIIDGGMSTL